MNYLHWNEKTITDFSDENIAAMYAGGYVFTRIGKGIMHQTRSVRIDLNKFTPTSENRRILKKTEGIELSGSELPFDGYDFTIGKMAKDFYQNKFGSGIMSAQKIKEMLTDAGRSNFNKLLCYTKHSIIEDTVSKTPTPDTTCGYTICYSNTFLLHYSYPFYNLESSPNDMGLGMMIRAVEFAKNSGMRYLYLGSLQRPTDTYKLQFEGLEWFDGKEWSADMEAVKEVLSEISQDAVQN